MPGVLLVEKAGGTVNSVTGDALDLHTHDVCAPNGPLHDALVEQLNTALQPEPAR